MSYTQTYRLIKVLELQTIGTFRKIEFVVASDEQYPQTIKFELQNDKCSLISGFFPGDTIEINFNIRGREWINPEGKALYFNSFVAWRLKKIENGYVVPTQENSPHLQHKIEFPPANEVFGNPIAVKLNEYKNQNNNDDSDLPF